MKSVRTAIDIAAPPERVWEVLMDPDRLAEWVTIHRKLGKVSDRPLRQGSTLEQTLHLRGANFKVRWKVVEVRRPELALWEGRGPAGSRATSRYELRRNGDGGTHFDYLNEFKTPMGPLGAAAGQLVVGNASEREAQATLEQLKALLERSS